MQRKHKSEIINSLKSKTVFLTGPRGAGKTTLALEIAKEFSEPVHLDCSSPLNAKQLKDKNWAPSADLLILDEVHKIYQWEEYLRELVKTKNPKLKLLCIDSSSLAEFNDVEKLVRNSCVFEILPFSIPELFGDGKQIDFERLMFRGAFPEPYLAQDDAEAKKWRHTYIDTVLHRDIFDFKKFGNFKSLALCFDIIRNSVGNPLSFNAISKELGVISSTAQRYITIFETLNIIFRIVPYPGNKKLSIARSLTKRPKLYFYDTGLVEGNKEAKFQNLMALSLLQKARETRDCKGVNSDLYYIRTKDGLCVDFCFVEDDKISFIAETKYNDAEVSKNLSYFSWKYSLEAKQIVKNLKEERQENGVKVMSADDFFASFE